VERLDFPAGESIRISGARTHHLKNITVAIPRRKLTVVTGVSGSGKSSLVFDTLYVEGQRRFLLGLRPAAQDAFRWLPAPDVELITGLPPVLAVEQQRRGGSARSTLGTVTELGHLFRVLLARAGQVVCPQCGLHLVRSTARSIAAEALQLPEKTKLIILAPIAVAGPNEVAGTLARITKEGLVRARINGELYDLANVPRVAPEAVSAIEAVIDRLVVKPGIEERFEDSLDSALRLGNGRCVISHEAGGTWHDAAYQDRLSCGKCGLAVDAPEVRIFSFLSPIGACLKCRGKGIETTDNNRGQAVPCPACKGSRLKPEARLATFGGYSFPDWMELTVDEAVVAIQANLQDAALAALPAGIMRESARKVLPEIRDRLLGLVDLGLGYLQLSRGANTLSAGEYQRARLAAQLGTGLTGVCYLLDEPTAGLHPQNVSQLIARLKTHQAKGNTIVVVEHDLEMVAAADWVLELGPGAGMRGGEVRATASPVALAQMANSLTGPYLTDRGLKQAGSGAAAIDPGHPAIKFEDCHFRNLIRLNVSIPVGRLTCVTGLSGSGKSTLVMESIVPLALEGLRLQHETRGKNPTHNNGETGCNMEPLGRLVSLAGHTQLVVVDQRPLGRTGRSSPATYSGLWDEVRRLYAKTKDAKRLGFTAARFHLHRAGGRCERCLGTGKIAAPKHLIDIDRTPCPVCRGLRFNRQTLGIRYKGLSVADVLALSIEQAAQFFANFDRLHRSLQRFCELGLGYLQLGQSALTLSGGEAQRVKLATALASGTMTGPALFVLDEPCRGLHPFDLEQLIGTFRQLTNEGHTVLITEHNLLVVKACDWMIELGPGAGPNGGKLVHAGRPDEFATLGIGATGVALQAGMTGRPD
jgi:excinuclease ABC subunit A